MEIKNCNFLEKVNFSKQNSRYKTQLFNSNGIDTYEFSTKNISFGQKIYSCFQKDCSLGDYSKEVATLHNKLIQTLNDRNISDWHKMTIQKSALDSTSYTTEEDMQQHIRYLITLFEKHDKNGNLILPIDTLIHFADFKNNGLTQEQTQNFALLFTGLEKELITLSNSAKEKLIDANNVNPIIISDLEKVRKANNEGIELIDAFIPEYESIDKNEKEINELKVGDFFSTKENETYIITKQGEYKKLNIDRQTLFEIMPPVKRFNVEQNKSGTCAQLATYISMLKNPEFTYRLLNCIKEDANGIRIEMPAYLTQNNIFAGKFNDFLKNGSVTRPLVKNKFIPEDKQQSVNSTALIKALEHLFGTHRKYEYADEYVNHIKETKGEERANEEYNFIMKNINKYVFKDKDGNFIKKSLSDINFENKKNFKTVEDYYKESANPIEIYKYFSGLTDFYHLYNLRKEDNPTFKEIEQILQTPNTIFTFGTLPENEWKKNNETKNLAPQHGFCITNYDPKTKMVSYINPWYSSLVFEKELPVLLKYIDQLDIMTTNISWEDNNKKY